MGHEPARCSLPVQAVTAAGWERGAYLALPLRRLLCRQLCPLLRRLLWPLLCRLLWRLLWCLLRRLLCADQQPAWLQVLLVLLLAPLRSRA
jgi:hypothetical protein